MHIFLDDFRHPYDAFVYTKDTRYAKLKWIIVRSYDEFVKTIIKIGINNIETISLDHDLSDEHYGREDMPWSVDRQIDYFSFKEKTGYECAKWLCDYCLDNNFKLPKEILIHSFNIIGAANIRSYINNFKKHNPEVI